MNSGIRCTYTRCELFEMNRNRLRMQRLTKQVGEYQGFFVFSLCFPSCPSFLCIFFMLDLLLKSVSQQLHYIRRRFQHSSLTIFQRGKYNPSCALRPLLKLLINMDRSTPKVNTIPCEANRFAFPQPSKDDYFQKDTKNLVFLRDSE